MGFSHAALSARMAERAVSTQGTKYVMHHAETDYRHVRQGMVIAVKLASLVLVFGMSVHVDQSICT